VLEPYLKPGDGVLDIGCNECQHAIKYAEVVGGKGHVLGVEPDPETCIKARTLAGKYPQLTVMNVAVTDQIAPPRTVYRDAKDRRRNTLWPENVIVAGDTFEIRTVSLDFLADLVPKLTGIKIDTQGAETLVLKGGQATLKRDDLTWVVEFWPEGLKHAGSSLDELVGMFRDHGWVPWKNTWEGWLEPLRKLAKHGALDIILKKAK
jgi:FkbM family methyltransferase